jgi:hypothetical protein
VLSTFQRNVLPLSSMYNLNIILVTTYTVLFLYCLTFVNNIFASPIPVAARSKAWVYGRSLAGIVGFNPAGGMDVCVL